MTAHDLLDALEFAPSELLAEAQALREGRQKRRPRPRIWLIAAVVGALLLLAGCVAYVMSLGEFSLSRETYTPHVDPQGHAIEPSEKPIDRISYRGRQGDPAFLGQQEWIAFLESCNSGQVIPNEPDLPEIPNLYEYVYGCYTPEMVQKVDEIAEKYDLKLLEESLVFQRWDRDLLRETVGPLLKTEKATLESVTGVCDVPSNLNMEMDLVTPDRTYAIDYFYTDKAYLPRDESIYLDLDNYRQWEYQSGNQPLLLALDERGTGLIYADRGDTLIVIQIRSSPIPVMKVEDPINGEALEDLAELFDYDIRPEPMDAARIRPLLEASHEANIETAPPRAPSGESFDEAAKEAVDLLFDETAYAFLDVDGDGQEDLLIGRDGMIQYWYQEKDGEVWKYDEFRNYYLCENRMAELESIEPEATYRAYYSLEETREAEGMPRDSIAVFRYQDGQWTQQSPDNNTRYDPVDEEYVESFREQYPRISISWTPLREYPLEDGQSLGQYSYTLDLALQGESLRNYYREQLSRLGDKSTHYSFLDCNGDGVEDLLLSRNGDIYSDIWTHRYGKNFSLAFFTSLYPCEGGILEQQDSFITPQGIDIHARNYIMLCPDYQHTKTLYRVYQDQSTGNYLAEDRQTVIPDEQVQEIFEKYPRINLPMYPIP